MKISQLQEAISQLTQQNSVVTDYYTNLKTLWEELSNFRSISTCKCTSCSNFCASLKKIKIYQDQDCVIKFLRRLNPEFDVVKSQILMIDPLPSMDKKNSLVLQQERQLNFSLDSQLNMESNICLTRTVKTGMDESKGSGNFNNGAKRGPVCTYCDKGGHRVDICYRKHGFPPGFKFTKKKQNTNGSFALNAAYVSTPLVNSSTDIQTDIPVITEGKTLSKEAYQMFLALLSSHHNTTSVSQHSTNQVTTVSDQSLVSNFGIPLGHEDSTGDWYS